MLSNKAIIIDRVDTSQQRAERLEVLTKTKQERFSETETSQQRAEQLRQRQMSTTSRAKQSKQYLRRKAEASHERAERLDDNYRSYTLFVVAGSVTGDGRPS